MLSSGWKIIIFLSTFLIFQTSKCVRDRETTKKTEWGAFQSQFYKETVEDTFIEPENFNELGIDVYAVFHGHAGYSSFYREHMTTLILNELNSLKSNDENGVKKSVKEILASSIADTESKLIKSENKKQKMKRNPKLYRSTTSCVVVIAEEKILTVANVGSTSAVLCDMKDKAIYLSPDLSPNEDSLGKKIFKKVVNVVKYKPKIQSFEINLEENKPKFMILSHGLWDYMDYQEAVNFINNKYTEPDYTLNRIAKELVEKALKPKIPDNVSAEELVTLSCRSNIQDNVSVMIVVFKDGLNKASSA